MNGSQILELLPRCDLTSGESWKLELDQIYAGEDGMAQFRYTDPDGDQASIVVRATHIWMLTNSNEDSHNYGVNVVLPVMRFLLIVQESLISVTVYS